MNQTTLSVAAAKADQQVQLASGTGVTARGQYGQAQTILYIGNEAMEVVSTSSPQSTTIPSVRRGVNGTPIQDHPIGSPVLVATATEASPKLSRPDQVAKRNLSGGIASTITTGAAVAFTPAQMLGGLILRDPNGAGRADTLPSAASLLAALPDAVIGTEFDFVIRNTADAAETITLTADAGATATISGTATIAQNNSKTFRVVITALGVSATYTVYSLGTVVH